MARKQGRFLRVTRYLLLASLSFWIGRTWRSNYLGVYSLLPSTPKDDDNTFVPVTWESNNHLNLDPQMDAQFEIQRIIEEMLSRDSITFDENPCRPDDNVRIMVSQLVHPKDGFASEFQYMARLLQMAVSTRRILILTPEWRSAYEPLECQRSHTDGVASSGWDCLWESLPVCSVEQLQEKQARNSDPSSKEDVITTAIDPLFSLSAGILRQKTTSTFFDIAWYSHATQTRMMQAPVSFARKDHLELRPDVLPHWERAYGRYWVRAQMAHALWRPNVALTQSIQQRMPVDLSSSSSPLPTYIGFHIRLTDNVVDLQRHFARNATITRSFERYMQFAKRIREEHANNQQKELRIIYLATDNRDVIAQSKASQWTKDWTFVVQDSVQRSSAGDQRMWFREGRSAAAAGIATDIEILRRADYLVGSFQSNVYRLACQLNTAYHAGKYSWQQQRHWTVDVEWYEDP